MISIIRLRSSQKITRRMISSSNILNSATIKPGDKLPGLDLFKDQEPIVLKEKNEYPKWVYELAVPQVPIAKLRKMNLEDATDQDMERYLKLTRRIQIREANQTAGQK